jgi:hypothetical protein
VGIRFLGGGGRLGMGELEWDSTGGCVGALEEERNGLG